MPYSSNSYKIKALAVQLNFMLGKTITTVTSAIAQNKIERKKQK